MTVEADKIGFRTSHGLAGSEFRQAVEPGAGAAIFSFKLHDLA
jgi:hypothetical protein